MCMCGMCAHVCACVYNALIHLCMCIPRSEEVLDGILTTLFTLVFEPGYLSESDACCLERLTGQEPLRSPPHNVGVTGIYSCIA